MSLLSVAFRVAAAPASALRHVATRELIDATLARMAVTLRTLADGDLEALFVWESDPRAVRMAAFTRADPSDRGAFDAHYERVRSNPSNTLMAIDDDGEFVGTIGSYTLDGKREVTYWIAPARWGQGLASQALGAFLEIESTRPSTVAWPSTMSRPRRCSRERASSRWAPTRASRRESAPTSSSASFDSTARPACASGRTRGHRG